MFIIQDFIILWQYLEVLIFIGYIVFGDIIDKIVLLGKYKVWIYQYDSFLVFICVWCVINISGIDGMIDQCILEEGLRFLEVLVVLFSILLE